MPKWLSAYSFRFWLAVVLTGLVAGCGGIAMHELLDLVEWLSYGKTGDNYLTLVESVTPMRRLLALVVMAILVAITWFFLQRKSPLVSVKLQSQSSRKEQVLPRFWQHVSHTFLQIAFVGAGGPVGKEGAPRELGALSAGRLSRLLGLRLRDRHLLIVCGAAAGLAAVYQVPLSSFFFAFETFGLALSLRTGLSVLLTTYLAAFLANPVVTSRAMYEVTGNHLSLSGCLALFVVALLVAPLAGVFRHLTGWASKNRQKGKSILWCLPLAGCLTGVLATVYPSLLGNGSGLCQLAFNGLDWQTVLILFGLKALVVIVTLVSGAYGGTLTPSVALGSLLGLLSFYLISLIVPLPSASFLMIAGAAAFLAVTMKAPLTATGLVLAFTKQPPMYVLPVLACAGLSLLTYHVIMNLFTKRS